MQNFDHLFNLKVQFTQKKELVVNNNTMMEYDFTKTESDTYSDFRNNSYSDFHNKAYSDKRNNIFFQAHPASSMMTPESLNKLMYVSEMSDTHTRFMTPKGSNIGVNPRDNCPGSARLELKMGNSRNFHPFGGPSKLGDNLYSMGVFRNVMDPRFTGSRLSSDSEVAKGGLSPFGGINWLGSSQNSPNEVNVNVQKTFLDTKPFENPKKTLSLKEKYKRKIMANKRKNKLKKQDESKDTVAPLSTESKTTLEKPTKESENYHEKTEKKEKEKGTASKKKKEEKTTAKKKSVIINPNVVVNNFSFKCEPKGVSHENNSFFQSKIPKEQEAKKSQSSLVQKDSNFSLTNLKENLSHESIEEGKLNIFRVFDNENSSEKNSILSSTPRNCEEKEIEEFLNLKNNSQSDISSKDSFKDFNFKMSSEEEPEEMNTDVMQTRTDGFRFGRDFLEDQLGGPLKDFAEERRQFFPPKESLEETLKHSFLRPVNFEGPFSSPISEILTFHSKFFLT